MKNPPAASLNSRKGFTLIEVLVSSFLTLIILGLLFTVLFGALEAFDSGTERLKTAGDARLALDSIRTDLESMIARATQYDQEWLLSRPTHIDSGASYTLTLGVDTQEFTSTWLTFFSPSIDRDPGQQGDMVGVSYRVDYRDPLSPGLSSTTDLRVYGLYKALTTTEEAFVGVLGFNDGSNRTSLLGDESGVGGGYWDDIDTGNPPFPSDPVGFLCPHVVKFAVSWLVRVDGQPELERFDETHTIRLANRLRVFDEDDVLVLDEGTLVAAEISLIILSEDGVNRLKFFQSAGSVSPSDLQRLVQEFGTTHTIRVPVNY